MVHVLRQFPKSRHLRDAAYALLGDSAPAVAARCRRPAEDNAVDEAVVIGARQAAATHFEAALASESTRSAELWQLCVWWPAVARVGWY